jgi:hypothetical protein
MKIVLIVGK